MMENLFELKLFLLCENKQKNLKNFYNLQAFLLTSVKKLVIILLKAFIFVLVFNLHKFVEFLVIKSFAKRFCSFLSENLIIKF